MIIDFTVTNFRSICDEQTLSLYVENVGEHLPAHVCYPADEKIGILKCLGLYGANASGKTNLLNALEALQDVVGESGDLKDGDPLPWYQPFRLSEETKNAPTRFEIEFITPKGRRYRYEIAFNGKRVLAETLVGYATSRGSVLFERKPEDTWETIKFGVNFKGGKRKFPLFSNNSYLSKAGDSADAPETVREVFNYFRKHLFFAAAPQRGLRYVRMGWAKDTRFLKQLSKLLALADTGIGRVEAQERSVNADSFPFPESMPEDLRKALLEDMRWKPVFFHEKVDGKAEAFEFEAESEGTKQLFSLAPMLFSALSNGRILLIDELESSMHPFLAELIINLFNDPEVNPKGAQLLFTTHNVGLMTPEKLRRDQIWFADKFEGKSRYYSLADFDKKVVKPHSPYSRWYQEGRFDAIPRINYKEIAEMLKAARNTDAET